MALSETQDSIVGGQALHVDHFGLSIGAVSVGLPPARTADDVYRRYLDLMWILRRGPVGVVVAPPEDLEAMARSTGVDAAFVSCRLAALQAGQL